MDILMQDLRYAVRSLSRAKGFTAVVALVIGLAIGANVLIFALVDGIMFRPWPMPGIERIVAVNMTDPGRGFNGMSWSWQNYRELQRRVKSFEMMGGYYNINAITTIDRDPEKFDGSVITSDLLPALGTLPVMGRNFRRDEEVWGKNWNQVIISARIWRTRFHSDPNVLDRVVRVNGRARAIVGVMPDKFSYPENEDFWIPPGFNAAEDKITDGWFRGVARLKPGVTIAQADAEVRAVMAQLVHEHPTELKGLSARVLNLQENWVQGPRPILTVMLLAVLFVLLVACANVANLMLARAASRRREISMRLAMGATRGRIVRQLLTESLLLAALGAVLGRIFAHWGGLWEASAIPVQLPWFIDFSVGPRAYAFIVALTMLSAVLFGLAPALHASDAHLMEALREGSAQSGTSRGQRRLRNGLVVAEIALSLVLLVGAGLMVRTMQKMQAEGDKLRLDGLVTAHVLLPIALYPGESDRRVFFREMQSRLEATPGVREVSAFTTLPLGNDSNGGIALVPGIDDPRRGVVANTASVMPGAFKVLGIPLLRGREFTLADDEHAQRVAVVSRSFAERMWKGKDAIGRRVRFNQEPDSIGWRTVVGVVADITQNVEDSQGTPLTVYDAELQNPIQTLSVLVRTPGDGEAGAAALRKVVRSMNPDIAVTDVRSMAGELHFRLWVKRLFTTLIGAFGVIALVIAAVGLYGVMAYSVAQRTQEIGIRMALGADASGVQRLVVGNAMRLTLLGVGIGLVAAFALTRFMTTVIQNVSPTDPPTFTAVTVALMMSGIVAAWVPSLRATRVDPMRALRTE
jgi:putative ABC transport system permease protein